MTKRILTGNEAVALGALRAGVKVVTGYPGTPSTGCVTHLLTLDLPNRHIEWSANEKVAFEIAAGAAWAGHRSMCTMKMSGVNVAYDALISIAYSGTNGGLVIYVADDPGVSAGMPEQDTRGFALMSQLPMLEPSNPEEAFDLVQRAFELSERSGSPVFLRSTTAVALGHVAMEVADATPPREIEPILEKDIHRHTKAGSAICKEQHQALIDRLALAAQIVGEMELNVLTLCDDDDGIGVIAVGAARAAVHEAMNQLDPVVSLLDARTTIPFPREHAESLLGHCKTVLVVEELEPYVERALRVLAQQTGHGGKIIGKLDGVLSPIGEMGIADVLDGLEACGMATRVHEAFAHDARQLAAARPITVCAGCPHRGTYLAIEAAIKRKGFSKDEVMVTGDIGCTILGMNPPFNLLWNEVSMGSSVSLAQGYVHGGVKTPVIATIGDSTFFHGGIPGLINAIQHRAPLTLIVMDNGWTSMTGMQVNAGTSESFQEGGRRVDLEAVLRGLGPDHVEVVDPYELERMIDAIAGALTAGGVRVVLAQRECAIQARRRHVLAGRTTVDPAKCVLCKRCLQTTGCPALGIRHDGNSIAIDPALCNGCGLCARFCPTGALSHEPLDGGVR